MGVDFCAILKYEGPTERVRQAIDRLEQEPPGEFDELVWAAAAERYFWGDVPSNSVCWSPPDDWETPCPRPELPDLSHWLRLRAGVSLAFGPDAIVFYSLLRVASIDHATTITRSLLDILAELNRRFHVTECWVTGDYHSLYHNVLNAMPFDEAVKEIEPGQDEVPHIDDIEIDFGAECFRFDEGIIPPPRPRSWPPMPDRSPRPKKSLWAVEPLTADALETLVHELLWETGSKQRKAARELARRGAAAREAVPVLIQALRKRRPDVRLAAVRALEKIGDPQARRALQALVQKDPDADVRVAAQNAQAALADDPGEAIAELLARESDERRQKTLMYDLGKLGSGAKSAQDVLLRLIVEDESLDIRLQAAQVLWLAGVDLSALPALRVALSDPGFSVRAWAARALLTLGDEAGVAVEDLIAATFEEKPPDGDVDDVGDHHDVRKAVAWALLAIGLETNEYVRPFLRDTDPIRRRAAAELLGRMRVAVTIPDLTALLNDPDESVRWAAAQALVRFDEDVPEVVAFLEGELLSENDDQQCEAVRSLGLLGKRAESTLVHLDAMRSNGDWSISNNAEWAWRRVKRLATEEPRDG